MLILLLLRSNSTEETPTTVTQPGCRSQFVGTFGENTILE
jgi:hypothetical protein